MQHQCLTNKNKKVFNCRLGEAFDSISFRFFDFFPFMKAFMVANTRLLRHSFNSLLLPTTFVHLRAIALKFPNINGIPIVLRIEPNGWIDIRSSKYHVSSLIIHRMYQLSCKIQVGLNFDSVLKLPLLGSIKLHARIVCITWVRGPLITVSGFLLFDLPALLDSNLCRFIEIKRKWCSVMLLYYFAILVYIVSRHTVRCCNYWHRIKFYKTCRLCRLLPSRRFDLYRFINFLSRSAETMIGLCWRRYNVWRDVASLSFNILTVSISSLIWIMTSK